METDILKSFRFLEIDPPKSRGGKGLRINQLSIKTNISKPYLGPACIFVLPKNKKDNGNDITRKKNTRE